MDFAERQFKKPVQQGVHIFRTDFLCQWGRVLEVTEENRDLFAFAFKGTSGRQDFFGEVLGCVGQRFAFRLYGRSGGWLRRCRYGNVG
jgi:hypothetical protein